MGNSALGQGAVVNDGKVKASSGDGSPDFLDAKVDGDTMTVVANQLVSVNEVFVNTFTRSAATATGSQAITGVGFQPKGLIVFMTVDGSTAQSSWGMTSGIVGLENEVIFSDGTANDNKRETNGRFIYLDQNASNEYNGALASFDADGFTINWVRINTPTGTMNIKYMAFK